MGWRRSPSCHAPSTTPRTAVAAARRRRNGRRSWRPGTSCTACATRQPSSVEQDETVVAPSPAKRRETFVAYTYPRATGDHDTARFARRAHRRSRHRARRELTAIHQVVNAAPAAATLDDLDVSPPPRRSATWDAG